MHFHLPKPPQSWREFAGEVGIIVVGITIALGAEQVIENQRHRHVAEETREAITNEINADLAFIQIRSTAEPCVARRLSELRVIVDQWGRTGTFRTPHWVAQAPRLPIDLPNYDTAQSAGRLAFFPRNEQYQFGRIVGGLRSFADMQREEAMAWATLRVLQSGADALSSSDRTMVREALQRADFLDYDARITSRQLLPSARAYGFKPDMARFREEAQGIWRGGRYTPAICLSIDTPADQANQMSGQLTPLPL